MKRAGIGGAWGGWAGLVAAPLAWLAHHQFGSDLNYADCKLGQPALPIAVGLAALAVTIAATAVSFSAWRRSAGEARPNAGFIPVLSLMAGGLFGLTIIVQTVATVILPPCFR